MAVAMDGLMKLVEENNSKTLNIIANWYRPKPCQICRKHHGSNTSCAEAARKASGVE